jgi:hypothetical protein
MLFNMIRMKTFCRMAVLFCFFEQHADLNEKSGGRLSVKGN